MNRPKLTDSTCCAHKAPMMGHACKPALAMVMAGSILLGGCINLEAPDEPIVIELNINITQEVIYRLADDAENTIDENADIF